MENGHGGFPDDRCQQQLHPASLRNTLLRFVRANAYPAPQGDRVRLSAQDKER